MSKKLFDYEGLLTRTMNDIEIAKEILECYIEDTPGTISQLEEAIEIKNLKKCREKAHEIKGSSASVGAVEMQAIAANIQQESEANSLENVTKLTESLIKVFKETEEIILQLEIMK